MKELDATKLIPLTEREVETVAGGTTLVVGRLGGCPGCTSGGYLDPRAAFAEIINPAQVATAGGALGA